MEEELQRPPGSGHVRFSNPPVLETRPHRPDLVCPLLVRAAAGKDQVHN